MNKLIKIFGLVLMCFFSGSCVKLAQSNNLSLTPSQTTIITQVAEIDLLGLCNKLSTTVPGLQEGYKNIFPGVTLRSEIKDLIGEPNEISILETGASIEGMESWVYTDFRIWVDPVKQKVDSVFIIYPSKGITIYDVINRYGCPSFIYAINQNEEFLGYYTATMLIYNAFGIRFDFNEFPITKTSELDWITYFDPNKKEQILTEWGLDDAPGYAIPIELVDPIK